MWGYYRYLDRFKQEPRDFADLMEFLDFLKAERKLQERAENEH